MFSYGSGIASSMFTLKVHSDPSFMRDKMRAFEKLEQRIKVPSDVYDKVMEDRKTKYGKVPFTPNVCHIQDFHDYFRLMLMNCMREHIT